jgi:hypothetical protein
MSVSQSVQHSNGSPFTAVSQPPTTILTRTAYLVAPLAVIAAALVLHACNNPIPAATLAILMTAAYGRTLWREYLAIRPLAGTWSRRALHERAETTQTITRSVRDTVLAVQPTTR